MVGKDQNGYITPAFSGVAIVYKHQSSFITPVL